ncbi:MAG: hypothetical protein RIC03_02860 [Cyclobacteriaceae bacterium]
MKAFTQSLVIALKLFIIFMFVLLSACEENLVNDYQLFVIPKGEHYCNYKVEALQQNELSFMAIFDSTTMYTSSDPINQHDINKLYGFSDCNDQHHENSARFGWRWLNETMEIHAYFYQNSIRSSILLGSVALNEPHFYSIQLLPDAYSFQLDSNAPVMVERMNTCDKGFYYKLFPYFGGDERAPHDIVIQIKEL